MSSTPPTAPNIRIRPKATDSTLEFWWAPPESEGDTPIDSYYLTDGVNPDIAIGANAFYYKLTGLTNSTPYSYGLYASNANLAGPTAPFRTVQPGFKPDPPTYISLFRNSETNATLSWNNPTTGGSVPSVFRNILATPTVSATGQQLWAGKNSVIKRGVYPNVSSVDITVGIDASYNFIVRSMNDPGYSLIATAGIGSLKDIEYPYDSMFIELDKASYQNTNNYIPVKNGLGPVLNTKNSVTEYYTPYYYWIIPNNFGKIIKVSNTISSLQSVKFINKNGFVKYTSAEEYNNPFAQTRTNPIVPIVEYGTYTGADSNIRVELYNISTNESSSHVITIAGAILNMEIYLNFLDENAYFNILDSMTSKRYHYIAISATTAPTLVFTSLSYTFITNKFDKTLYVLLRNKDDDTLLESVLYIPNTGSHKLIDISGYLLNAGTVDYVPFGASRLILAGSNETSKKILTLNFSSTPTVEREQDYDQYFVSFATLNYNNFIYYYQGYTTCMATFRGITDAGDVKLFSPIGSSPPLDLSGGTSLSAQLYFSTTNLSGILYFPSGDNIFYVTSVTASGTLATTRINKPNGDPLLSTENTYTQDLTYPTYSLLFFSGTTKYVCRVNADQTINTYEIDGYTVVVNSVNPTTNLFTVTDGVGNYTSYAISDSGAPTDITTTNYYILIYSTYPSGNYTLAKIQATTFYDIYDNTKTKIHSNIDIGPISATTAGPDCWYFWYTDGSTTTVKRLAINGTITSIFDPTQTGSGGFQFNLTDTGFVLYADSGTSFYTIYEYNTTRGTFVRSVLPGVSNYPYVTSTYLPKLTDY